MHRRVRLLMLATGLTLVIVGLTLEWLLPMGNATERTATESLELVGEILNTHQVAEAAQPTEFDRLRTALDLSDAPQPVPERVDGKSFELYTNVTREFLAYWFEKVGYTGEKIDSGATTAIPPLIVLSVEKGWADDISVQFKKSLFYRVLLPLILFENRAVLDDRERLVSLAAARSNASPVRDRDLLWLRELAVHYRVMDAESPGEVDDAAVDELLLRVDMVPPSMALGQAAYESGYATSRFAHTGNALFGQWDWSEDAIKPEQQRAGKGNYGIKAFEYPIDSVRAYLYNLNTHRSYRDFRMLRAQQRGTAKGRFNFDAIALAGTLLAYSERGAEYTEDLQGMMRFNRLELADQVRLLEGEPIFFD